jgi:hypothetical protein
MSVPRQTRQPLVPGGEWCRLVSRAADSSDAASTSMARHHFSDPAGPPIAHYTSDRRRLRPPDLSRHPRSARATRRATVGVARPVPALVMVADDRGASIVTTMYRLVVVRDRAGFRPRSGVRSWRHEVIHGISLSPPMRGQARMVVRAGSGPDSEVSMFFAAEHWPEAARIVGEVRRLAGLDGTHS